VFDLAGDLRVEQSRVERLNAGNAAADGKQRLPCLLRRVAYSGDEADARDYDSAGNK
jgi:hypothetical protein